MNNSDVKKIIIGIEWERFIFLIIEMASLVYDVDINSLSDEEIDNVTMIIMDIDCYD